MSTVVDYVQEWLPLGHTGTYCIIVSGGRTTTFTSKSRYRLSPTLVWAPTRDFYALRKVWELWWTYLCELSASVGDCKFIDEFSFCNIVWGILHVGMCDEFVCYTQGACACACNKPVRQKILGIRIGLSAQQADRLYSGFCCSSSKTTTRTICRYNGGSCLGNTMLWRNVRTYSILKVRNTYQNGKHQNEARQQMRYY